MATLVTCARCDALLAPDDREYCWYCHEFLCYICWDEVGHCGHTEAAEINEQAQQVPQPLRARKREQAHFQRIDIKWKVIF